VHEVVAEPISLRDRVRAVLGALRVARRLDFESLFDDAATRLEIIVTFLAVLELMKMGVARAIQQQRYGGIVIELAVTDVSAMALDGIDEYSYAAVVKGVGDGRGE